MSTETNRSLVADIFDRMGRGELTALTEAMSDDFSWAFPPGWSWSGAFTPKSQALEGLLRPLMVQFSDYKLEAEQIIADGDHVVVRARAQATTVRGDEYPQQYCYVLTMREGQITRILEYCNSALVERVLEPVNQPG